MMKDAYYYVTSFSITWHRLLSLSVYNEAKVGCFKDTPLGYTCTFRFHGIK